MAPAADAVRLIHSQKPEASRLVKGGQALLKAASQKAHCTKSTSHNPGCTPTAAEEAQSTVEGGQHGNPACAKTSLQAAAALSLQTGLFKV